MNRSNIAAKSAALLLLVFLCPGIASAVTPQITVSATATTLLGTNQTISITCTLIDPQQTGIMRIVGTSIIPPQTVSSVTPGSTVTLGPLWGSDVIANGFGVVNSTFYRVQTFTVTNGIIASTPALSNFYQFQGSGTVDLSTATPLAPSFMSGASGNVVIPGTLTATQLISNIATGTPPLVVTSTTNVPNLNASTLSGLAAPASAIVGISDTQTLTGKTFDTAGAGNVFKINGTQVSAVTGSGSAVLATSPSLTTPSIAGATVTGVLQINASSTGFNTANPTNPQGIQYLGIVSGTCTMSSGTCNANAGAAFSIKNCFAMWNGTGTLTGIVKAVLSGVNNTCTVTSSVGTDTAQMQLYWLSN